MEEWRDVKGFEGMYQVSNLGNIKSLSRTIIRKDGKPMTVKENVLKPFICGVEGKQYIQVRLCDTGSFKHIRVHQLVAVAFLGHTIDGHKLVIDHVNDIKTDNRADNLQIVTSSYNRNKRKLQSAS